MALDFDRFTTLTFDCYGTLVDWEKAALAPLKAMLDRGGIEVDDDEVVRSFLELDEAATEGAWRCYAEVLGEAADKFGARYGIAVEAADRRALVDAIAGSTPFGETLPALQALAARYRLAIISNTDKPIITRTVAGFGSLISAIVTSEEAKSYKPADGIFEHAVTRLGVKGEEILHVAEGLGEVIPARRLGMGSVWVRRSERSAGKSTAVPDMTVGSLTELLGQMGL